MDVKKDRRVRLVPYDALPTEHLLSLHERLFAPLDPKGKRRILDAASRSGWDVRWNGMDGLAA